MIIFLSITSIGFAISYLLTNAQNSYLQSECDRLNKIVIDTAIKRAEKDRESE